MTRILTKRRFSKVAYKNYSATELLSLIDTLHEELITRRGE